MHTANRHWRSCYTCMSTLPPADHISNLLQAFPIPLWIRLTYGYRRRIHANTYMHVYIHAYCKHWRSCHTCMSTPPPADHISNLPSSVAAQMWASSGENASLQNPVRCVSTRQPARSSGPVACTHTFTRLQCTPFNVHRSMRNVQTPSNVQRQVYNVQCTTFS